MMEQNYYELLEISERASTEIIKAAYRAQMKKFHPDKYQGDKVFAERRCKELNTAYSVLSDPEQRTQYDRTLKSQTAQQTKRRESTTQDRAQKNSGPEQVIAGYCEECGEAIKMPRKKMEGIIREGRRIPRFCRSCYKARNEIDYRTYCEDCGEEITLTRAQVDFYLGKGWDLPRRCRACREERKAYHGYHTSPSAPCSPRTFGGGKGGGAPSSRVSRPSAKLDPKSEKIVKGVRKAIYTYAEVANGFIELEKFFGGS